MTYPPHIYFVTWYLCIQVQVWDTAGQERFRKSMVEHYYRNVHAVVFVYDVTKMASFENLKTWIQECNGHRVSASVPRVLVGNKCDLVDQIQVPSNMALKFADAHNMLLFETSAKDPKESQNVDSIFMCLACRLKAQKSLIYRNVEREDGRVRLNQEPNPKTSCPCWKPVTPSIILSYFPHQLRLMLITAKEKCACNKWFTPRLGFVCLFVSVRLLCLTLPITSPPRNQTTMSFGVWFVVHAVLTVTFQLMFGNRDFTVGISSLPNNILLY